MTKVDAIIGSLPDRPLDPEEVKKLENVSGIDRATAFAGGGSGDTAIVLASEDFALGLAYDDGWEAVDSIKGDCTSERFNELTKKTAARGASSAMSDFGGNPDQ